MSEIRTWSPGRLARALLAPVLLMGAAGSAFARAFDRTDLIEGVLVAVGTGWAAAITASLGGEALQRHLHRRTIARTEAPPDRADSLAAAADPGTDLDGNGDGEQVGAPSRRGPGVLRVVVAGGALIVGYAVAVAILGDGLGSGSTVEAVTTFLTVALPAPGLRDLALVILAVVFPATVATTWASVRDRTLATIAVPVVALGIIGVLVGDVGAPWHSAVAVALVTGVVLLFAVRDDLADLPPLVGSNTELRRQVSWWRPLLQLVAAAAAVGAVGLLLPHPDTIDVRRFVDSDVETVVDPNPLAIAARWRLLDDPQPVMDVEVDGEAPGRFRVAVLDGYTDTGWAQAGAFAITGDALAPDPLFEEQPAEAPDGEATVTLTPADGPTSFRAVPTAGIPRSVLDPGRFRYAPGAGILLTSPWDRPVTYRSGVAPSARPTLDAPPVADFPSQLTACPTSEPVALVAQQLTAGTTTALDRLDRIEDWLLTRRIYDPEAPGGQTVAAVEQFVSQPFARGNLEVFVTTYAVLARCAGVPTRVVVGFPAAPQGTSSFDQGDVTVWVETPLVDNGWIPLDPLPTPAEQELQAQLAEQDLPEPEPDDPAPEEQPTEVTPVDRPDAPARWPWVVAATTATLLVLVVAWMKVVPSRVTHRRRRTADPTAAAHAAWSTVTDTFTDLDLGLRGSHTPSEVVRLGAGKLPVGVPWLVAGLGPIVDRVRYGGSPATEEDAGQAWAYSDEIVSRTPTPGRLVILPLTRPGRTWARLASTFGVPRRREPWSGDLPESAILTTDQTPTDLPDLDLQARIGEGSTGVVYRAIHRPTGDAVAVKAFRYGPADPGFDQHRFDWEVRIAMGVSGLAHLPEVVAAGISPTSGRPYLASTLYEQGTLHDRVRRGGPLTTAEAIGLGVDLAVALDALHQLGVVHADVKPENIFASPRGWVLGDLGSAWLRASHGPAATLTPPYAAPEVWRGSDPTPGSDLYSLALTMLYAATGEVPVAGNPPSVDAVTEAFPDHPDVLRALEPNPRRRPTGAADLARRLQPELAPTTAVRMRTLSLPTASVAGRDR